MVSVRFRPKFRLEICFGFGVSAISFFGDRPKHFFRPKQSILAKIPCFGQKFAQKYAKNIQIFGRKRHFWPKLPISAEKSASAKISVSAKISALLVVLISVSVFRLKICFVCPLLKTNLPVCLFTHSKGIKIRPPCQELRGVSNV